jgi:hypothetical protein
MSAALKKKYREVCNESPVWPAWKMRGYEGQRIREFVESLRTTSP